MLYKIVEKVITYCTVEVEAECAVDAMALYENDLGDLDWSYDTDYNDVRGVAVYEASDRYEEHPLVEN